MKLKGFLLAVSSMEASVRFYQTVLNLRKIADFGDNVTLTGGIFLQTKKSWEHFIETEKISLGGKDVELYFEEDAFDDFSEKLKSYDIRYVHPVKEHSWGQRVIRFYDPDGHIIEVGEAMSSVCRRFLDSGMTPEQIAQRMDVPISYVKRRIR